jgi:hypothetical protein
MPHKLIGVPDGKVSVEVGPALARILAVRAREELRVRTVFLVEVTLHVVTGRTYVQAVAALVDGQTLRRLDRAVGCNRKFPRKVNKTSMKLI